MSFEFMASVINGFATKAGPLRVEKLTVWDCVSTMGVVWHPKKPCGNLRRWFWLLLL